MGTIEYKATLDFYIETCCQCGCKFGIEQSYREMLLKKPGTTFYCPNGHGQHYTGISAEEKLRRAKRELDAERANNKQLNRQLQDTKRSLSATKGVLTRTKNRIKNGVCPCCNRQFVNLHRHIKTQHPEYLEEK